MITYKSRVEPYTNRAAFPSVGKVGFIYEDSATTQLYLWNGTTYVVSSGSSGVTSVGLTLPPIFSVSGSPVTGAGTLVGALVSQTAKAVLAAPNAANGVPAFRQLVKSDISGIENVDNTADANKNVSTAVRLTTQITIGITGAVVGTATGFDGSGNISIPTTSVDATKLVGVIPLTSIPPAAVERLTIVPNDTARFALTTDIVQNGDTIKVTSTLLMYFVVDDTKLNSEAGYEQYTVGQASSVPWSGITGKPTTVSGYGITDVYTVTNLQTSGQAQVHWNNVTNKVNAARGVTGLVSLPTGTTSNRYLDETGNWTVPPTQSGGITSVATTNSSTVTFSGNGTSASPLSASAAITETDPTVPAAVKAITPTNIANWNTAFSNSHTHGNKAVLDGITSGNVSNWNTAFGWGDHSVAGYLKTIPAATASAIGGVKQGLGILISGDGTLSADTSMSSVVLTNLNTPVDSRYIGYSVTLTADNTFGSSLLSSSNFFVGQALTFVISNTSAGTLTVTIPSGVNYATENGIRSVTVAAGRTREISVLKVSSSSWKFVVSGEFY